MTVLDRPLPALLPSARTATSGGHGLPRQVASRALAQAAALLVWAWLVTAPAVVLLGPDRYDVPAFLAVLVAMAAVAAVGTLVTVRRPEALLPVTAAGLTAVAAAVAAFDVLTPVSGSPANPAVSLVGTACLVCGLVLRPLPAGATAVALSLWHAWWDLGPPWAAAPSDYLEILLTGAVAVLGARFVAVSLVRSSVQVSELVAGLLEERRAEQARRVRRSSLTAARTDLHDTVLTTLSGIGAGWLGSAEPEALRAELRRDVALLSEPEDADRDATTDLSTAVRTMTGATIFERLDVTVEAPPVCPVPAAIADALLLAAREALVNVLKHSGALAARVTVRAEDGDVRVTVRDEGAGFDPTGPRSGMGLAGVEARMAGVGGAARVLSAPGAGTTVVLELSASPDDAVRRVPPLWSVEGPRRGAIGLTLVAGTAQVLSFGLQSGSYADPTPQVLALLVALGVDTLVVVILLRRPDLPGWVSAVVVVRIPVVLLVTGLPLEGCTAMTYAHFSGGGELITCLVVTLLRPPREAVAATAAYIGSWVVLAAPLYAAGQGCGITAVANSAMVLGLVVAGLTFVAALRRHAAIAAEVLAAEETLLAARTAQEVRVAERRRLLPVVRGIVAETLIGLADARLDPEDPEVRRLCRRDARLLRAFLSQAGDSDELIAELFARSVRLRQEQIDLDVRGTLPRESVGAGRRRLLAALDRCLTLAVVSGWRGEGVATVLRAGDDVLLTTVLHDVPPHLTSDSVGMAVRAGDDAAPLDHADLTDGDLWVTFRLTSTAATTEGDL